MEWIDFRSDTVTKPTEAMRRAMMEAEVGDDVYGDDPAVNLLEQRAAEIIGKEAALFVVSGTMGNQVAVMTHTKRGDEIIAGLNSHIMHYEVGGPAILSGVMIHPVNNPDGMIRAADVEAGIRGIDLHFPDTGLLCLENALSNGRVVPMEVMREAYDAAHNRGIPVHLDGARIFNAAHALGVKAKDIAACTDSVMFCLSKGLCAPIGSILAGPKEFIARARKHRKLLGGGTRQVGVVAAPGLVALETMVDRLAEDHDNAKYLAERLDGLDGVSCPVEDVDINMVFYNVHREGFCPANYAAKMKEAGMLVSGETAAYRYRLVTHHGIGREEIDRFVEVMEALLA